MSKANSLLVDTILSIIRLIFKLNKFTIKNQKQKYS